MRTGIKIIRSNGYGPIYVPYQKIVSLADNGEDNYMVRLVNYEAINFNDDETFERIKNYILTKHPVVDERQLPPEGRG